MSEDPTPRGRAIATGPLAVAGAAVALVALGSIAYPIAASAPEPPAVVVEPVASNRLLCPDPVGSAAATSTVTGLVAPGLAGQKGGAGSAALATIPPKGTPVERVAIPKVGLARSLSTSGTSLPPVAATARGALAPGLTLDQFTIGDRGTTRGLAAQQCFAAGTSQWFVGAASGVGRTGTVTLANPEETPASVDVLLWGPSGPLPAPAGRGVLVPARGQVRLSLSKLAPGVAAFVVHVVTRSGRVVSAVSDQDANCLVPRGLEWVPATTEPTELVVVAGIPSKVSPVRLSVLSPTKDATVRVRLMTPAGAFAPKGLTTLTLTAGQLEVVDLTKVLREQPAAVELSSSAPIVAGAIYRLGDSGGVGEFAYAAGAPPLSGPAAVAGLPGGGYRHRLYLSNPNRERDASVLVTTVSRDGKARRVTIKVPKGTTQVWTAKAPDSRAYSIVVAPGRGAAQVRVMRVTSLAASSGTMAAGVPMWPVRSEVRVPEALPNLGVAID